MKRLVKDLIIQRRLSEFATIGPEQSIAEALDILISRNCSALLVVKNNRLQGLFSEKDYAKSSLRAGPVLSNQVESIMTTKIYFVELNYTLEECLQIMSKVHVRHLPVMDKDKPIALISMRHIMEALVDEKENQIRELTKYITGSSTTNKIDHSIENTIQIPIYSSQQNQDVL